MEDEGTIFLERGGGMSEREEATGRGTKRYWRWALNFNKEKGIERLRRNGHR